MNENFAFMLPVMQLTFGIAALIAGRWRVPSARWWGIGFLLNGFAFAIPGIPFDTPGHVGAAFADALFAASFFCWGQALLVHCGRPAMLWRTRIAIATVSTAICAYAVVGLDKLRPELLASDIGCALLLAIPLLCVRDRMNRSGDRTLMVLSWMVVLDAVSRVFTVAWIAPEGVGGFETSYYAFFYQATAAVFGVAFAMSVLASIMISVLTRYRNWAVSDPLSGLLNRRGFEEAIAGRGAKDATPVFIVAADIDHFKAVNDRFGHHIGDGVIVAFAEVIRATLPEGAFAARFGGEEFIICLPGSTTRDALHFAEAVRTDFSRTAGKMLGDEITVTASFGISATQAGDYSVHDTIHRADEGLYEAKRAGRNRTIVKIAASDTSPRKVAAA